MIAVVQRVAAASVRVKTPPHHESIERGLCVLLGAVEGDTTRDADWMCGKIERLRIFPDDEGRMNRSVTDIGGAVLLVSQFTLAADTARGNRPSFVRAADPSIAEPLVEHVARGLEGAGLTVRRGVFGADMRVSIENDGPVTIILQSPAPETA